MVLTVYEFVQNIFSRDNFERFCNSASISSIDLTLHAAQYVQK